MRLAPEWEPARSPWRANPEEVLLNREHLASLRRAAETCLTKRERMLLRMRLSGVSLQHIGELFSCTAEAVRQQQQHVVEKLREHVSFEGPQGRARLVACAIRHSAKVAAFAARRNATEAELLRRAEVERVLRDVRPPTFCAYERCPHPSMPVRGHGKMHRACISERHRLHLERLKRERARQHHIGDSPQ
jgi:DNA-binding CsgD family transcriptional regulator